MVHRPILTAAAAAAMFLVAACSNDSAGPATEAGGPQSAAPADGTAGNDPAKFDHDMGFADDLTLLTLTAGDWSEKNGEARFGEAGREPHFTMACDRPADAMLLWRAGAPDPDRPLRLGLFTQAGNTAGHWRYLDSPMPNIIARVSAKDDIFPKIAASDRFGVGTDGLTPLVLPVSDEVRQVIRRCTAAQSTAEPSAGATGEETDGGAGLEADGDGGGGAPV